MKKEVNSLDGDPVELCDGRRRDAGAARRRAAVHRLARRPLEQGDQMLRHLFRARRSAGSTRARTSPSPAFRSGRSRRSRCFPTGPNSSGCGSRSMTQTPVLQGTTRADQGRRLHRRQRNPARRRGARRAADRRRLGPQGCPVIPASSGGLGALLNSAPELIDRIQRLTERLTELLSDKNQNSIADILENIDTTTKVLRRARARPGRRHRDARIAARNAGIAAQQCRHAGRQHQPPGQRAGQARRRGPATRRSRRSSRRPTISTR